MYPSLRRCSRILVGLLFTTEALDPGRPWNNLLLVTAPGRQWFERILAAINMQTWLLNQFIFTFVAGFVYALIGEFDMALAAPRFVEASA